MRRLYTKLRYSMNRPHLCLLALAFTCSVGTLVTLSGWPSDVKVKVQTMNAPNFIEESIHRSEPQRSSKDAEEKVQQEKPVPSFAEEVKARCAELGKRKEADKNSLPSFGPGSDPIVSLKKKAFFCPMAKAGSTYFTRYFIAAESPGPMKSPYSIRIKDAGRSRLKSFSSLATAPSKRDFLNNATKIVFSREPYSRLFSAFIDKLYSPNPYYWSKWGSKVVRSPYNADRPSDSSRYPCSSGVPFRLFVKSVIKRLSNSDIHFIPMHKLCNLCLLDYDVVGKIENSVEDVTFLSRRLNISSSFLLSSSYKTDTVVDMYLDNTDDPFLSWYHKITTCIGAYNLGRIIWRKLQIRGVFLSHIPFPFSEEEMKKVDQKNFREAVEKAISQSDDPLRLKQQKQEAFIAAYRTVDMADMEALAKLYHLDFILFAYEPRPASLFDRKNVSTTNSSILDWTKPWST